ncbi:hypothetical protein BSKO_07058 [Bryopsis sp. KO-2023]|nr:hypothetical protein BSKO_07058 [Bryopsis sp. KO-2023]
MYARRRPQIHLPRRHGVDATSSSGMGRASPRSRHQSQTEVDDIKKKSDAPGSGIPKPPPSASTRVRSRGKSKIPRAPARKPKTENNNAPAPSKEGSNNPGSDRYQNGFMCKASNTNNGIAQSYKDTKISHGIYAAEESFHEKYQPDLRDLEHLRQSSSDSISDLLRPSSPESLASLNLRFPGLGSPINESAMCLEEEIGCAQQAFAHVKIERVLAGDTETKGFDKEPVVVHSPKISSTRVRQNALFNRSLTASVEVAKMLSLKDVVGLGSESSQEEKTVDSPARQNNGKDPVASTLSAEVCSSEESVQEGDHERLTEDTVDEMNHSLCGESELLNPRVEHCEKEVPHDQSAGIPDSAAEKVSEVFSDELSKGISIGAPEEVSEPTPGQVSEEISEEVPREALEKVLSEEVSEYASEGVSERVLLEEVSVQMPEKMLEEICGEVSEEASEGILEQGSQKIGEEASKQVSRKVSEELPKGDSDEVLGEVSKENSDDASKEAPKESLFEVVGQVSEGTSSEVSSDITEKASKETSDEDNLGDNLKETPDHASEEDPKATLHEFLEQVSEGISDGVSDDVSEEEPKKENSDEVSGDDLKDTPDDVSEEDPKAALHEAIERVSEEILDEVHEEAPKEMLEEAMENESELYVPDRVPSPIQDSSPPSPIQDSSPPQSLAVSVVSGEHCSDDEQPPPHGTDTKDRQEILVVSGEGFPPVEDDTTTPPDQDMLDSSAPKPLDLSPLVLPQDLTCCRNASQEDSTDVDNDRTSDFLEVRNSSEQSQEEDILGPCRVVSPVRQSRTTRTSTVAQSIDILPPDVRASEDTEWLNVRTSVALNDFMSSLGMARNENVKPKASETPAPAPGNINSTRPEALDVEFGLNFDPENGGTENVENGCGVEGSPELSPNFRKMSLHSHRIEVEEVLVFERDSDCSRQE